MNRILVEGESYWVRERVSETGVLVDGKNYYSMFYAAAARAEKYILLSGWQFDSKVELVRGPEAAQSQLPTAFLPFLNELCKTKPDLRVYVLAWDFSVFFALEREWLQKIAFDWMTHEHLNFAFDGSVPMEGSHHQKFVVVDGVIAFVGSADLCEHRWDERSHALDNPARFTVDQEFYPPYHEVQAYVRGPVVKRLVELFARRWTSVATTPLELSERTSPFETPPNESIRLPAEDVALCGTSARAPEPQQHDIREMFTRAIQAAEELVYVETQYLTARSVVNALVSRMEATDRPKLQIVFVLPTEPEAPKEELAMGILQARAIHALTSVASKSGHALGIYSSVAVNPSGEEIGTYIHSKLIVVDDRFLSLGSANLSNRSMGVDTELNLSFETESPKTPLGRAIRRLRMSLMAEHVGLPSAKPLVRTRGLVERLNEIARSERLRLRVYEQMDPGENAPLMSALQESVGHYLDPERPHLESDLEEPERWIDNFTRGISVLRARLAG